jgi:hypothetical protein
VRVDYYSREDWLKYFADVAHAAVFDPDVVRQEGGFGFALLVIDEEKDEPIIYVTCAKNPAGGAYIEYGGSFPNSRGSQKVLRAFQLVNKWFEEKGFTHSGLMTRNTNKQMNRLALATDYFVTGVHMDDGRLYLDYTREFTNG